MDKDGCGGLCPMYFPAKGRHTHETAPHDYRDREGFFGKSYAGCRMSPDIHRLSFQPTRSFLYTFRWEVGTNVAVKACACLQFGRRCKRTRSYHFYARTVLNRKRSRLRFRPRARRSGLEEILRH